MTNTFTLADLQAMADADLNALAASLRGLTDYQVILNKYKPTTNRNQSGELLRWASTQGVVFDIAFGHYAPDERHPHIEVYWPVYNEATWRSENKWLYHIPGNDARAETIAFCAAMLAMAGRLQ